MKEYCSVCLRKISVNVNGKICRHGFKKNQWTMGMSAEVNHDVYLKVDSRPCQGSWQEGLTAKQLEERQNNARI